jgi:hypothetical protein
MKRVANPAYCQVKDCHQKYTISCQIYNRGIPGDIIENETIAELGTDEVANVLSFLPLEKIMCLRRVNMPQGRKVSWPLEKLTYTFVGIQYKKCAVELIWAKAANI